MEIIDKRTKKEHWELGDVLEANSSISKGLIVKNSNGDYFLMDITPGEELMTYSTIANECLGDWYETLSDFYEAKHHDWHKVNAKLVI